MAWFKRIFGGRQGRREAAYERRLAQIASFAGELTGNSDDQLAARAAALRQRLKSGTTLDDALCEAFALTREASGRVLGMRHYDVQLMGGMALHDGLIAEMKTGEGKTLAATLPAVLNGMAGGGVHIVTVNDYLAQRDAEWMGPVYRMMGLSVGVVLEEMDDDPDDDTRMRQEAYGCDITYGTNHEIAFDYLRDNLVQTPDEFVQRGFAYAIVDEVDFLLIDEARTPLIISGSAGENLSQVDVVKRVVQQLNPDSHYAVEPRTRTAILTELGYDAVCAGLGVDDICHVQHIELYQQVYQSVLAHAVYKRDVDYIVDNDSVYLVDEFTGRVSEDKRFADGLHQALEAKEGVTVKADDRTEAMVTYQTFFARYGKLAGMTGTAWSEREEFRSTYGRDVQVIPTNRPTIRRDDPDLVFDGMFAKHERIIEEIRRRSAKGQPVLVGTTNIRESEEISRRLKKAKIPHKLLNAKNHHKEAAIIAQAGRQGAVTISTNMAGRGVDIVLGGNPELLAESGELSLSEFKARCQAEREQVVAAGGLHVIGTGRHESSRIDDQLRGRAGRQGDPGSSQFVISLDDELWQMYGRGDIAALRRELSKSNHPANSPISSSSLTRLLRDLQEKVEIENQAIRADVRKYDLVVHTQRENIYGWRRRLVADGAFDPRELIADLIFDLLEATEDDGVFAEAFRAHFQQSLEIPEELETTLESLANEQALAILTRREESIGRERLHQAGRQILLSSIDELWTDHLSNLERVGEAIGLQSYAGKDPVLEWQKEAAEMWHETLRLIRSRALTMWFLVEIGPDDDPTGVDSQPATRRRRVRRG